MANKKIWAYGKNQSSEYIKDSLGRNRMFFIWEALKLKRENPSEYNSINFLSTQTIETDRGKMTAVRNGFFRYIENQNGNSYSGDGESLSHSIAIAAISKLKELNLTIGERKLKIIPEQICIDNLNVQFENGNYYYPDLICTYSSPSDLIEKWGNKIALEVKVSHPCEAIKIKDFEDHNFPIIEITLNNNMLFLKELRKEPFSEDDLENYYNFLIERFSNNIYGKVISNPVRLKYHKKITKNLLGENENLKAKFLDLEKEYKSVLKSKENELIYIQSEFKKLEHTKDLLFQENMELKNKSFLTRLRELF